METNSRLIHNGEVSCRCVVDGSTVWQKDAQLFLFDQSLIICKKDLIKKNHYIFRDRITLNSATFIDCKDGKGMNFIQENRKKYVKGFYDCRQAQRKEKFYDI